MRLAPPLLLLAACGEPAYLPEEPPAYDSAAWGGSDGGEGGAGSVPCSSTEVGDPRTLRAENQRTGDVGIFWVDTTCAEIDYGTIPVGLAVDQPTYEGHVWAFRDRASGELLDWVQMGAEDPTTVVLR